MKNNGKQYASINELAEIFGYSRWTIRRRLEEMRQMGKYNEAVIEDAWNKRRVNIELFRKFVSLRAQQMLRGC
ncbi:DeoR family transcriptional regulator [Veillonella sp.]|uniref:DeoR family transcriptional regulator n=1 Tax=Veillonella sp. TaxID=1926307 RepID=UPI0025F8FF16|nr:DeoR family transcriptional regulator [Veillonella sp.]